MLAALVAHGSGVARVGIAVAGVREELSAGLVLMALLITCPIVACLLLTVVR